MKIVPSFFRNCFKSTPEASRIEESSPEMKIQSVLENADVIFTPVVGSSVRLFSENLLRFIQNPANSIDDKVKKISNEMQQNSLSWCGGSPLSVLSSGLEGYNSHLEIILAAGANPNGKIRSSQGHEERPLHKASYMASREAVSTLLKYGADPSLKDDLGRKAKDISANLTGNVKVRRQLNKLLTPNGSR